MRFLHTWSRPERFFFCFPLRDCSQLANDKRDNNACVARRLRHIPVENDRLCTTALVALEPATRAYWLSCLIGVALPARVHERPRFGRPMSLSMRTQDKHAKSRLKCLVNIPLQLPCRLPWRESRLYLCRSNVETHNPLCVRIPSHTSCDSPASIFSPPTLHPSSPFCNP